MDQQGPRFNYFLSRPSSKGRRPPGWIRPAQWALLAAWFSFAHWITAGEGFKLLAASFYNFYGIFTDEIVWGQAVLPNLGLVSLAVGGLLVWLQVVWRRCGAAVEGRDGAWRWLGRRGGPEAPDLAARTPGGAWVRSGGRWAYVAHGFVDDQGRDWIVRCGAPAAPWYHPARVASPLAGMLVVLLGCAWALQIPVEHNRRLRSEAARAVWEGEAGQAEVLARRHPEIRPWIRYMESQGGCDLAPCFQRQLVARLEGLSIGPVFGDETKTLVQLLVLNGWSGLALKLTGPNQPEAFQILVRQDRPAAARRLPQRARGGGLTRRERMDAALLLEEGRFEAAYGALAREADGQPPLQRAVALRAALAYLTGRCAETQRLAALLLAPYAFNQSNLYGDAPAHGLGALQRAARDARVYASFALGLALLDYLPQAGEQWRTAETMADAAGLPGLLDMDRVLLRRVAPLGPWAAPSPPHGRFAKAVPSGLYYATGGASE